MFRVLTFAVLLASALAAKKYNGYKVLRVTPKNDQELGKLFSLKDAVKDYVDFWKSPTTVDRPVDMLISPLHRDLVVGHINRRNLEFEVTVQDLQKDIDEERVEAVAGFSYTDYNTLDSINSWMDDFALSYPNLVEVVDVGSSYEGRTIRALKISGGTGGKPVAWYEGGIHAREWISPATIIYMTKLLVEGYVANDLNARDILDNLDVYMLPVYNVDGYEFTWNGDRMWRKTRKPLPLSSCYGVDPNRNWDYQWLASSIKCSEAYPGPNPFSEIEVSSVTDYITNLNNDRGVLAFIDFHAYGEMWMTPCGYTTELPKDNKEQIEVATESVKALQSVYEGETVYDTNVGPIATVIYQAYGSSVDWTYGALGIVHSYAVELRNTRSFIISSANIEKSGRETYEALKVTSLHVIP
ncbi:carboxypeptidase B-like [Lytechinus pictus]|uniref:carboxypeptidase B-like n=1 Tax=Lytechinus pictus TaxID=7653 RepID=UPI0030BA0966